MDCYIPKDSQKGLISELFDPGLCKDINCPELLLYGYTSYAIARYNCQRFKLSKDVLKLLADRRSFCEYALKFYKDNKNLSKNQLVDLVHKDLEETLVKTSRNIKVKKSEIKQKINAWFLKDYGIELRRRFGSIEEGREKIKEFLISNPEKRSKGEVQKELRIGLYTYFKSMKEALEYAGLPYKDSKKIEPDIIKTIKENPKITLKELEKRFGIDMRNYFKNTRLPYIKANVEIPWRLLSKEERKERIKNFIKENPRTKKKEIEKKLHTDLKTYFKKEEFLGLYRELGLEIPLRLLNREERIKKIRDFIKENPKISKRKLEKKFSIDLRTYPEIMKELEKN